MGAVKKEEGPRDRVESFIERRREDVGEFIAMKQLQDGYIRVEFERAIFYTPVDDRVVYREGCGYERPMLSAVR